MPVLPDGWELDYDGSRWVYRFTASGLTQYQFPKPGDEFSEFAGIGDSFVMAPEDCLASDRQVKQQSTDDVGNNATKPSAAQRKKRFVEDMKEVEEAEYLDTEKFMYLGPGLFTGSHAFGDQQARTKLEAKHSDTEFRKPPSSTGEEAKATPTGRPIADNLVNENYGTAQEPPPRVAGGASKGAKPREGNAATDTTHSIQTKLSMQSPVGFVAELASHEIRKQETHMPDIEPGVPKRSMAGGLDATTNPRSDIGFSPIGGLLSFGIGYIRIPSSTTQTPSQPTEDGQFFQKYYAPPEVIFLANSQAPFMSRTPDVKGH